MGGSIRSSPRNSICEKAVSDHKDSEESYELMMKKSAKSANVDCDRREQKSRVNSGLVKLAKQKTGKFSKQSNSYLVKRGIIINSYFQDEPQNSKDSKMHVNNDPQHKLEPNSLPPST